MNVFSKHVFFTFPSLRLTSNTVSGIPVCITPILYPVPVHGPRKKISTPPDRCTKLRCSFPLLGANIRCQYIKYFYLWYNISVLAHVTYAWQMRYVLLVYLVMFIHQQVTGIVILKDLIIIFVKPHSKTLKQLNTAIVKLWKSYEKGRQ